MLFASIHMIYVVYHQWYTLNITSNTPYISPVIYLAYHQRYTVLITSDIPCLSPVINPAYHQWYTLYMIHHGWNVTVQSHGSVYFIWYNLLVTNTCITRVTSEVFARTSSIVIKILKKGHCVWETTEEAVCCASHMQCIFLSVVMTVDDVLVHTAHTALVQPLSKVYVCIACLVQGNV